MACGQSFRKCVNLVSLPLWLGGGVVVSLPPWIGGGVVVSLPPWIGGGVVVSLPLWLGVNMFDVTDPKVDRVKPKVWNRIFFCIDAGWVG